MRETEIKLAVIRWLLGKLQADEIIAAELQFSNAMSRADLIVSSITRLCAYEIKSSYDDFRRFEKQQEAYRSAFLENYLVIPTASLQSSRGYLSRSTGILIVNDDGEVTQHRKSQIRSQLSRKNSLSWLRDTDFKKLKLDPEATAHRGQLTEHDLTSLVLKTLYERLKPRFDAFRQERGESLNSDDLGMLSLPTRVR